MNALRCVIVCQFRPHRHAGKDSAAIDCAFYLQWHMFCLTSCICHYLKVSTSIGLFWSGGPQHGVVGRHQSDRHSCVLVHHPGTRNTHMRISLDGNGCCADVRRQSQTSSMTVCSRTRSGGHQQRSCSHACRRPDSPPHLKQTADRAAVDLQPPACWPIDSHRQHIVISTSSSDPVGTVTPHAPCSTARHTLSLPSASLRKLSTCDC